MKKKMITALCALTLTLGTAGSCFAAETNPQTTQAYINVPATAIDFSVTEEIIFDGTADTDFAKLGANVKKIGIMAAGSHDMSTGAYTGAGNINPQDKVTVALAGKTG